MSHSVTGRSSEARPELVEGADGLGPRVDPEPVALASRLRSPILEHRAPERPAVDDDRPTFLVPPLRVFLGPSQIGLIVGLPLLLLLTWQAALAGAVLAVAGREIHRRTGRADFSFGAGFLPYHAEMEWPHGVQEDDEVHWHWAGIDRRQGATD